MTDMERTESPVATPVVVRDDNEVAAPAAPEGGVPTAKAAGPNPAPMLRLKTSLATPSMESC